MQKRVKGRLFKITIAAISIILGIGLILGALEKSIVFFYTPSEFKAELVGKNLGETELIRLGGKVQSIINNDKEGIAFELTDGKETIYVIYKGALPSMFRVEQGVVVRGRFNSENKFMAENLLIKHDEYYRPESK